MARFIRYITPIKKSITDYTLLVFFVLLRKLKSKPISFRNVFLIYEILILIFDIFQLTCETIMIVLWQKDMLLYAKHP